MVWIENKKVMAQNINHQLSLKGKTRKEACQEMGFGYSTFTEWANGRKYPRIDKIEIMANYFGCEKSDLIEDRNGEKPTNEEIGKQIKARRLKLGWTQKELGEKIGVNSSAINRWESGLTKTLKVPVIKQLAEVLGIDPIKLLGIGNNNNNNNIPAEMMPGNRQKHYQTWRELFDKVIFSDEEFEKITQYAKFLVSQRK